MPYNACMYKPYIWVVLLILVGVGAYFAFFRTQAPSAQTSADYKSIAYTIAGQELMLGAGGLAYFGNEVRKDLNGDGREDIAFLVTYQPGGSGTFYYVVAALATSTGYIGSSGYLLGDRIAPQTTESGAQDAVIINYADRASGESFATPPSVGKSAFLTLDPATLTWQEVKPEFGRQAA